MIRIADVIAALRSLDQSQYSFVADVGDSWFISLELRADVFLAAGYYSSMGFAVPAALGRRDRRADAAAAGDRGRRRVPDDRDRAVRRSSIKGCDRSSCS